MPAAFAFTWRAMWWTRQGCVGVPVMSATGKLTRPVRAARSQRCGSPGWFNEPGDEDSRHSVKRLNGLAFGNILLCLGKFGFKVFG
jgi:hypothetical protein